MPTSSRAFSTVSTPATVSSRAFLWTRRETISSGAPSRYRVRIFWANSALSTQGWSFSSPRTPWVVTSRPASSISVFGMKTPLLFFKR